VDAVVNRTSGRGERFRGDDKRGMGQWRVGWVDDGRSRRRHVVVGKKDHHAKAYSHALFVERFNFEVNHNHYLITFLFGNHVLGA
jgi:hypothetical protein